MILNGIYLLIANPIKEMLKTKQRAHGVSHGLSEVGYDIRIKQEVKFIPPDLSRFISFITEYDYFTKALDSNYLNLEMEKCFHGYTEVINQDGTKIEKVGRTALASSIEEFDLPDNLWGELRNKSTHARRFFDATLGTDMEPNWKGFLTIEIIFHANEEIIIPAGSGIAKAVFHELKATAKYDGKYQNQEDKPVPSILEK